MDGRTVGRVVVEALVAEGTEFVFGLAGSHTLEIFDALADAPQIRLVTAKHENNAAAMADMYGRLTGRPGVVLVTAGPGAVQSASGVAQAYAAASPIVHLSGTVPMAARRGEFHGADDPSFLEALFRPITKWSVRVTEPAQAPEVLARAFAVAVGGRPGPVHVEIPQNLLKAGGVAIGPYRRQAPEPAVPTNELVASVAAMLRGVKRPVICAGLGVLRHGATAELEDLAEALGAPVVVAGEAVGAMPEDHPLMAGYVGTPDQAPAWPGALASADTLVAVGFRAGTRIVEEISRLAPKRWAFIAMGDAPSDADVAAPVRGVCDNRRFLNRLIGALEERGRRAEDRVIEDIAAHKRHLADALQTLITEHRPAQPLHFGVVVEALARRLPREAVVIGGIGNHNLWGRALVPVRHPAGHVQEGAWGSMGFELPAAIAASLVHPQRPVVAITGDGSFLMAASDLATAAEVGARCLILVMNDARYGMIETMQTSWFGRTIGTAVPPVDCARMAEACGAAAVRVTEPQALEAALDRAMALAARGPVVVDAVCASHYPCPNLRRLAGVQDDAEPTWTQRLTTKVVRLVRSVQG